MSNPPSLEARLARLERALLSLDAGWMSADGAGGFTVATDAEAQAQLNVASRLITTGSVTNANVTLDGVLTSEFPIYELTLWNVTTTVPDTIRARLRVGGVDAATNYTYSHAVISTSGVVSGVGVSATTYWVLGMTGNTASHTLRLLNPAAAAATGMAHQGQGQGTYVGAGYHSTATAYDGVTVYALGGSFLTASYALHGLTN